LSRFVTLTGMALRELWISFRLLLVLGAFLLAGLPAALLPPVLSPDLAGAPPDPLAWLAVATAAALALAAAVAAATLATERRRGTAAWMAARAVSRSTIALSWFAAFALVIVVGLVPLAMVAWLVFGPFLLGEAGALVAATAASACAGCAALAIGLLAGAVLPRWPAAAAAALAGAILLVPPAFGQAGPWWLPSDGLRVLAELDTATRPVADSLRAAGAALGLAAVVLVGMVVTFERADL
jgi:hypothetical protein